MLLMSILQGIRVFWFSLFKVPRSIPRAIRKHFFHFLWEGNTTGGKYHLCAWDILSNMVLFGGWVIKFLARFNVALCATSLWRD